MDGFSHILRELLVFPTYLPMVYPHFPTLVWRIPFFSSHDQVLEVAAAGHEGSDFVGLGCHFWSENGAIFPMG